MTEIEWLSCGAPDLMLDELEGKITRQQLVEFVRRCCERVTPYVHSAGNEIAIVEEFATLAAGQSDHDAAIYAYEASLKAARWAPDMKKEQAQQAAVLRQIVGRPMTSASVADVV